MKSDEVSCPQCGHWRTRLLSEIEEEERASIEAGYKPETPVLKKLRDPLGPGPLDPRIWAVIAFLLIGFVLVYTGLHQVVVALSNILATAVAYYAVIRPWYEDRLRKWRNTLRGARVCMKCWAAFIPSTQSEEESY